MKRWLARLFVLPFLAVPWLVASPTGDLSAQYTDHLRHAHAAQVFLARGLSVNRMPFGEAAAGVAVKHPGLYWTNVPYAYPPGALLLFLPVSIASEAFVERPETHARLLVTFTTLLAVLAWLAVVQLLLPAQRPLALAVGAFACLGLMRAGLEGFYDPAWVGLGALAILALRREAWGVALALCAAAAFVHLRAVVLAPVAAVAVRGLLTRGGKMHGAEMAAVVVVALDAWICAAVAPYSELFRGGMLPLYVQPVPVAVSVVLSAGAVALCVRSGRWPAALGVAAVLLVALVDNRAWWHASVALVPMFLFATPSSGRLSRLAGVAGVFLFLWAIQLQRFAWGGHAWDLPSKLVEGLGRTSP